MQRKTSKRLTISDVARAAGVSPMTVSRVINDEKKVRPATRDRVKEAIAALDFIPNPAARSLAGLEHISIGLLYNNPSAVYLSEFLAGSLEQARISNVQLVVEKCEVDGHEEEAARWLVAAGMDGIVLPPPLCNSSVVLAILAEAGVPTVAVASGFPPTGVSAVGIDDFEAAKAMTRHIISLGHRHIGFITGNPNQTTSARRLEGYRTAMADARIPIGDGMIEDGLFTYRSGLDAAEKLLGRSDIPSAIFASNDDMAAAAVAVAHRNGLDVPGDLTVCGFDDTILATIIWPQLTTIHQPIADMSRAALQQLVAMIKANRLGDDRNNLHTLMDFTLIRRQSDAAPRRRPSSL